MANKVVCPFWLASHTYAADRTYTVILTVTDTLGATGSSSQDVTASAPGPRWR
jgi:PKD repeat protein